MAEATTKSQLEQLRDYTIVVVDTGDIDAVKEHRPQDATTNPSLLLQASQQPQYRPLLDEAVAYAKKQPLDQRGRRKAMLDKLFVNFGREILQYIPGRVSTEVDARLSFDVEGSVEKARQLIRLYELEGIDKERILIKLASTWESICAARLLEAEGIHCNMTLMFCLGQAAAAAQVGATLISPFVGRILDWYRERQGLSVTDPEEDPGVQSVKKIYAYLKAYGYRTQVMGASFRNSGEIRALSGCDLLTIAPQLLRELEESHDLLPRHLHPPAADQLLPDQIALDEKLFRWQLNEDPMATDKLADGIRRFAADAVRLEEKLAPFLEE